MYNHEELFNPTQERTEKPLSRITAFLPMQNQTDLASILKMRLINKSFKKAIDSRHFFFKPSKSNANIVFCQLSTMIASKATINRELRNAELLEFFNHAKHYLANNLTGRNVLVVLGFGFLMMVLIKDLIPQAGRRLKGELPTNEPCTDGLLELYLPTFFSELLPLWLLQYFSKPTDNMARSERKKCSLKDESNLIFILVLMTFLFLAYIALSKLFALAKEGYKLVQIMSRERKGNIIGLEDLLKDNVTIGFLKNEKNLKALHGEILALIDWITEFDSEKSSQIGLALTEMINPEEHESHDALRFYGERTFNEALKIFGLLPHQEWKNMSETIESENTLFLRKR